MGSALVLAVLGAALAAPALAAPTAAPVAAGPSPVHGKGSFAPSPRGRIYFETVGSGPPLFVLAGGPGASHAGFHPWFERLAPASTVLFIDNAGRGRSDDPRDAGGHGVTADAEDVEAVRSHLGYERISVLGHSYGAFVALEYALAHPERVSRLVLSAPMHNAAGFQSNIDAFNAHCRNQYPEIWEKLMRMRRQGVKSSAKEYADILSEAEADMYWYDPAAAALTFRGEPGERVFSPEVYTATLGRDPEWVVGGSLKGYDPTDRMRRYVGPVLLCAGRYDRIAPPRLATAMAALLPLSRLVVFERSGHRPWVEEAGRYFEVVGQFLAPDAEAGERR